MWWSLGDGRIIIRAKGYEYNDDDDIDDDDDDDDDDH